MSDLFHHLYICLSVCSLLLPNVFQTVGLFWRTHYYYSALEVTAHLWYVTIVIQNWFKDYCMAVIVNHMLGW